MSIRIRQESPARVSMYYSTNWRAKRLTYQVLSLLQIDPLTYTRTPVQLEPANIAPKRGTPLGREHNSIKFQVIVVVIWRIDRIQMW
jgi:hypothetical protein